MVSHVNIPINIYELYQRACIHLLDNNYDFMIVALKELNETKVEDFNHSKYVIVDIDEWQNVFNASIACWMGQKTISRLTLKKTISSQGKVLH